MKTIAVPWSSPVPAAVKGIIHVPAHNTPIKPGRREALLIAIAKARNWIDDLAHGRVTSFAVIARREGKVERHIRLLAPLAFLSPRIVSALLDGTAPADLTVMALVRALPYSWTEQERRVWRSFIGESALQGETGNRVSALRGRQPSGVVDHGPAPVPPLLGDHLPHRPRPP